MGEGDYFMQQTILRLIGITLLLLAPFHKTFAWGAEGHRLICALAEEQLSPAAKTMLSETLQMGEFLDGNGSEDFPEACLWADKSKYTTTYEQHSINAPRAANSVVSTIQQNLVYLSRSAKGKREKARKAAALRFLAHFVADLHQPLDVGNGEDWGGNKIALTTCGVCNQITVPTTC
ncbi:MAG: hypothetical protein ACJAVI_005686 [Candidatus Azotimanducaceae bacterium]|jgi:hypothetical protein